MNIERFSCQGIFQDQKMLYCYLQVLIEVTLYFKIYRYYSINANSLLLDEFINLLGKTSWKILYLRLEILNISQHKIQ